MDAQEKLSWLELLIKYGRVTRDFVCHIAEKICNKKECVTDYQCEVNKKGE